MVDIREITKLTSDDVSDNIQDLATDLEDIATKKAT